MCSNIKAYLGITRQMAGAWIKRYYRFTTIEDGPKNRLFRENRYELLSEKPIFISMKFGR